MDIKQDGLLKEDAVERLGVDAAQDYINELEAQVKVLTRSKANLAEQVNRYDGDMGVYLHFKEILITLLQHYDVMDIIKDAVLDGLPDLDDLDSRISDVEYENENKPDDYEVVDNVVDSMTFESRVKEIISESLKDVTLDVKFDTTNL